MADLFRLPHTLRCAALKACPSFHSSRLPARLHPRSPLRQFQNARVYVTLQTDTMYVQETQIAGVNVAYVRPFIVEQIDNRV